MSPASVDDPDQLARRRARQIARDLHPDRGGDPDAYLAALAAVGRGSPTGPSPSIAPRSGRDQRPRATGAGDPLGVPPLALGVRVRVRQRRWGALPGIARRRLLAWRRRRRRRPGSGWVEL